ncbi:MAG TPA: RDD family protein [Xanthomonadales bacterium]|nr:RDD family protein [Xanthomonadales bacterium]
MPSTSSEINTGPGGQAPCGLVRLLLVMLYDAIAVLAIFMIAGAFALLLPFQDQTAGKDAAYTLYLLLFWFLYLAWCWRHGGMTLGMRAWKVRLFNQMGESPTQPPTWWQCGLRFVVAWLSALLAGAGYWWMLFDGKKRTWHDMASRTRLVHLQPVKKQRGSDRAPEEVDSAQPQQ